MASNIYRYWASALGLALGWLLSTSVPAGVLTTQQIVSATLGAQPSSCWRWQIKGVCFWLACIGPKCSIKTSAQVEHYLPDLTVSVFARGGTNDLQASNPWQEQNAFNGFYQQMGDSLSSSQNLGLSMSGGGMQRAGNGRQRKLHFFDADAIGNPAVTMLGSMSGSYMCGSEVTMMYPYYISRTDALEWRHKLVQQADPTLGLAVTFGAWVGHDSANPLERKPWGYMRPVVGFIAHEEVYKGAAVLMHRVAHLVTRRDRPYAAHVYQSVNQSDRDGYWSAEDFNPQDEISGLVQELQPNIKKTCAAMPPDGSETDGVGQTLYPPSPGGQYLWNIWRPYTCCERKGQKFIRATYNPPY